MTEAYSTNLSVYSDPSSIPGKRPSNSPDNPGSNALPSGRK